MCFLIGLVMGCVLAAVLGLVLSFGFVLCRVLVAVLGVLLRFLPISVPSVDGNI